ncbi:GTP cyclohydrolase 1 [Candidatus Rubidus massiliensis]|nr:MAG: GTP cyclohydrolase I FolE [Chlamydia sp. 32-24]CDZ80106.1 GTP cyclohydrolase 1 [Candidatus Rubidus massiliensis]
MFIDIEEEVGFSQNQIDFNLIPSSPFRKNNFSEEQKIQLISYHFEKILEIIGLDLTDDSICKTPHRFAKMLIQELFKGLDERNFPTITTQENKFNYDQMLFEANISIKSVCEHHFAPILGYCHIAYFPKNKVIGLSKLNRVAQYFASRPQVQERMTRQIKEALVQVLETDDIAVVVDAVHLCVRMRGVQDNDALTRTASYGGKFNESEFRREFLSSIPKLTDVKL